MATQKGKGGGSKKYGRNKKWCDVYRQQGRCKANKIRKVRAHIKALARRMAKRPHLRRDRQAENWLRANDANAANWLSSNAK